jgi:hypothetical protein
MDAAGEQGEEGSQRFLGSRPHGACGVAAERLDDLGPRGRRHPRGKLFAQGGRRGQARPELVEGDGVGEPLCRCRGGLDDRRTIQAGTHEARLEVVRSVCPVGGQDAQRGD